MNSERNNKNSPEHSLSCDNIPKTLIIGRKSFLAKKLLPEYLRNYPDTIATTQCENNSNHPVVNLENPDLSILNLPSKGYSQALICAGITDIAYCEKHPQASYKKNVLGVLEIAKQLNSLGIKPIVFSSDIVFDGLSDVYLDNAPTSPLNEYARQKEVLEKQLPKICGENYLILRISKVYSASSQDDTLLYDLIKKISNNQLLEATDDLFFKPLLIDDLKEVILRLQIHNASGIFNICGPNLISWYKLVVQMTKYFDFPIDQVKRVQIESLNQPFKSPKRLNLAPKRFMNLFPKFKFHSINQSLERIKTFNSKNKLDL